MEELSGHTTIAGVAELSFRLFQQCLQLPAAVPPRELSLVEDQFARFSIWTANIGVFAAGRASLDHRLREAPEVQEVVTGLLEALNDRVGDCSSCLGSLAKLQPDGPAAEQSNHSEKLNQALRAIANTISLLHRLSNTIRRAGKESQNLKAAISFKVQDAEGNDAGPFLRELFSNYIRDKFPEVTEPIRLRLASTMFIRRRRILYRRSRFGGGSIKVRKTNPQPEAKAPLPKAQPTPIKLDQASGQDKPRAILKGVAPSPSQAAASATTLAVDKFNKASTPSVISMTKTIALSQHEELVFPPPPLGCVKQRYREMKKDLNKRHRLRLETLREDSIQKSEVQRNNALIKAESELQEGLSSLWEICVKAIGEVTCPFCFYALPALDVNDEKKWKAHVKNDLDAYVCLFNECHMAEELYGHSDQWLKHMSEHALRWRCRSKSHGTLVFDTRDQYVDHMREAHEGAFTNAQLQVLADKNARTIGPLFKSCPLCGENEVKNGKLEDHIVGHLRLLALRSLPPYEDEGSESSGVNNGSSRASKPQKRSTIDNDPDKEVILDFPSISDNLSIQQSSDDEQPGSSRPREYLEDWDSFSGSPAAERREFEWGLITAASESTFAPEDDPIIQNLTSWQTQDAQTQEFVQFGAESDCDLDSGDEARDARNQDIVEVQILSNNDLATEDEAQINPEDMSSVSSLGATSIPPQNETTTLSEGEISPNVIEALIATGVDDVDLILHDEDYFDSACQQLLQFVQEWVLLFSKSSDFRRCRRMVDIQDEKIADRYDNTILDGFDVDMYLADRVRRRDVFVAVVMNSIWEYIFTRYLFGLGREFRQKLKKHEKSLPPAQANMWRAKALTALSKQPLDNQRESDTKAVTSEILWTLSTVLPPPKSKEREIEDSLHRVIRRAVSLSIEMRMQPAEYIMLPPLQPEYDTNGDLASLVYFNASLMNERSGETTSNDDLEANQAVVRIVLSPLVVKKGNDSGEGDEEIVICPAQVLVAPRTTGKSVVRVLSPDQLSVISDGGSNGLQID